MKFIILPLKIKNKYQLVETCNMILDINQTINLDFNQPNYASSLKEGYTDYHSVSVYLSITHFCHSFPSNY